MLARLRGVVYFLFVYVFRPLLYVTVVACFMCLPVRGSFGLVLPLYATLLFFSLLRVYRYMHVSTARGGGGGGRVCASYTTCSLCTRGALLSPASCFNGHNRQQTQNETKRKTRGKKVTCVGTCTGYCTGRSATTRKP